MEFFFLMKKSITCEENYFSNFSIRFLNPKNFSNLNYNCSIFWDLRNLQEQVKKHSVVKNCSGLSLFELIVKFKNVANSRPSTLNSKSFSWSLEQFLLTIGQNNFRNKIQCSFWLCNEEKKSPNLATAVQCRRQPLQARSVFVVLNSSISWQLRLAVATFSLHAHEEFHPHYCLLYAWKTRNDNTTIYILE